MTKKEHTPKYQPPRIRTLTANDVLSLLGPARALMYIGGTDDEGSDY